MNIGVNKKLSIAKSILSSSIFVKIVLSLLLMLRATYYEIECFVKEKIQSF